MVKNEQESNMQDMLVWAQKILSEKGYAPLATPQVLRSVPWSTVWCLPTARGKVYLKSMAQDFAYEPALLSFLMQQKLNQLPVVLATHPVHHCFLMEDAGEPLLPILETNYDIAILERVLESYARLQLQCMPFVDQLKKIGLSDLRPRALPALFEALLANSDLGFKSEDLANLRNSQAMLTKLCLELDDIGIPTTLEHGDFPDDNILIRDNAITFLDFGDATLSHPFFSLAAFLNHAENHHGLKPSSQQYVTLRDAYLQEWQGYASHNKLVHGFAVAYSLLAFVWAFGLKRIQSCPGIDAAEYASYVDKVMNHFYATFPRP